MMFHRFHQWLFTGPKIGKIMTDLTAHMKTTRSQTMPAARLKEIDDAN